MNFPNFPTWPVASPTWPAASTILPSFSSDGLQTAGFSSLQAPLHALDEASPPHLDHPPDTFPLLRRVAACFDLCLNPYLLSQPGVTSLQSVSIPTESMIWHHVIWIRFNPHFSEQTACLSFYDPFAFDLLPCKSLFAELLVAQEKTTSLKTASLWNFAAPSFPGKTALKLIANLAKICEIKTVLIQDGSVSLPCCAEAPLASRKLIEIFTHGQSWYERQGATDMPLATDHQTYFENEFALRKLEHTLQQPSSSTSRHFTDSAHFIHDRFSLLPSRGIYEQAKKFLHTMPLAALNRSIVHEKTKLETSLEAQLNCEFLEAVLHKALESNPQATIGTTLKEHTSRHEALEYLVSNKNSAYYALGCLQLQQRGAPPSRLQLAIAFSFLSKAMTVAEHRPFEYERFVQASSSLLISDTTANLALQIILNKSLFDCQNILPLSVKALCRACAFYGETHPGMKLQSAFQLLEARESLEAPHLMHNLFAEMDQKRAQFHPQLQYSIRTRKRRIIFDGYERYSTLIQQLTLERFDWAVPPAVKTRTYSTRDSRAQFVATEKILADNSLQALLAPALRYLLQVKILDFLPYCSQLVECLHKKYPRIDLECTLRGFIERAEAMDAEAASFIMHTLLFEATAHLEVAAGPLFSKRDETDTYYVFMIAKQLCEQRIYTALPI